MKKVIWTLVVSAALVAGLANAQSPKSPPPFPVENPIPSGQYSGTILSVGADKITLWDGQERLVCLVNASTTCGRDNALSIMDLEPGQQVTVYYAWYSYTFPTATHIDPCSGPGTGRGFTRDGGGNDGQVPGTSANDSCAVTARSGYYSRPSRLATSR